MDYKALMDAKKAEDAIKESKVSLTKKIEEALEWLESYLSAKGGDDVIENWDGQTPRDLLTQVRIMLKRKE